MRETSKSQSRPRFLLLYATREGQTASIAAEFAAVGDQMGVDVDVKPLPGSDLPPLDDYAGIALGGSIHLGELEPELSSFTKTHAAALSARHASMFIVCLTAAGHDHASETKIAGYIDHFLEETGFKPGLATAFAGALRYSAYGLVKRQIVRFIARMSGLPTDTSRDYELTAWPDVDAFAEDVIGLAVGTEWDGQVWVMGASEEAA